MSDRVFNMTFASIHPLYVAKVERKGRIAAEVDEVICWLTGYDTNGLAAAIADEVNLRGFFAAAPAMNPNADQIIGTVCGVKIDEINDPLMRQIRWMDKLIDELAKGRPMAKILRSRA